VNRNEKEQTVASLKQMFEASSIVVVTHYTGLTVAEMTDLRARMRDAGAQFKVTKNRLTRIALEGTTYQPLQDLFTGPTAVAISADPVAAAKIAASYAKDNEKLVILGGAFGEQVLDVDGVKTMASLPSLDELRGKMAGLLKAPATKIAGVLQAPAGQVARVIGAYGAKDAA
jgi:large subunit ribosomal protein L10